MKKHNYLDKLPQHEQLLHLMNGARCKIKMEIISTGGTHYLKFLNLRARKKFKEIVYNISLDYFYAQIEWEGGLR